ncbi:MAG: HEAT repeat domain-containing protein [Phycisphaerales bacterium]|nr:HEAT repeat domain-containing protein [Phycisphaerales bacterium]
MAASSYMIDLLQRLDDALLPTWAVGWRWRPQPTKADYERSVAASKDALAAVQATGDWRFIPSLLYVLSHDNAELRFAGATVINDLAASIPVAALPGFEVRLRDSTLQAYSWNELRMEWVAKQEWPPRVWAMLTMHPSGYVREAALRRLTSEENSGLALPYFLLRINDWVEQVRTVATAAVKGLLAPQHASAWVPVLGLVDQLRFRSRADHAWLTDAVTSLLLRPESRPELMTASRSEDRLVARWAFRAAMTLPDADRAMFVSLALQSGDPVVRLHAAKALRAWAGCPDRELFLANMSSDRFMPIRREALYAALDDTPERRRTVLRAALLDRHASMRHAARFYLRDKSEQGSGDLGVRAFYLDAIAHDEPCKRSAAISGVGECGTKADADSLAQFASDGRSAVASAAVRAVAALDGDHRVEWLIGLLCDDRPSVAREAGRALESLGNNASVEALRQVLNGDTHEHSRRYALRILLRRHPYDAVVDAVTAAGSGSEVLVRVGTDFIHSVRPWRVPYGPSDAQKAAARSAIRELQAPLPENLCQRLRDVMGVALSDMKA